MRRRVVTVRLFEYFRFSHWILLALAIAAIVVLRVAFEWRTNEWIVIVGLVGVWMLAGLARSITSIPSRLESLILLDRCGNWKDRFSSAWEFSRKSNRSSEEDVHVTQSLPRLEDALRSFPKAYQAPSLSPAIIGVTLAIGLAFVPWGRSIPDQIDLVLTPEMQEVAEGQSETLRNDADRIAGLESLTEEEKAELEALLVGVDEVANSLADAESLTAGEMLEALEGRARAAERLAEKLGLADDAWASAEMLAAMAEHPDTVDLALTIKDQSASPASEEAMELFRILNQEEIRKETRDRMTLALEQIMAAANDGDRELPVGERFGNASGKLSDGQTKTAAREFEELAKHFRLIARRKEAEEKLDRFAESLREAGSEVSGGDLEQMEQIASEQSTERATPAGLQEIGSGNIPEDLQKLLAPQMGQSGAGDTPNVPEGSGQPGNEGQEAPVPGLAQGESATAEGGDGSDPNTLSAPVPGESPPEGQADQNGQGMGASNQAQDGEGEGGLLSAPVPGAEPPAAGDGVSGMSLAGRPGSGQGQGGDQAGMGTAPMVDNRTDALTAAQDGEVATQINQDGESSIRAVEGQARAEKATRSRQDIVKEFLSAEEQALDGKSLPKSRREHIIRYFSAIRKQFEEADSAP